MSASEEVRLPSRTLTFEASGGRPSARLEWLVTNGIGGYASGTVASGLTRRYHGLLIAALPAPLGRMMYLCHLRSHVRLGGETWCLEHEDPERLMAPGVLPLLEFRSEGGLPVWRFRVGSGVIEKRIVMAHGHNTTAICYQAEGVDVESLRLEPLLQIRPHDAQVSVVRPDEIVVERVRDGCQIHLRRGLPDMSWQIESDEARYDLSSAAESTLDYALERDRGYAHTGTLWMPGAIEIPLHADNPVVFIASTEPSDHLRAVGTTELRRAEIERRGRLLQRAPALSDPVAAELALAADQFLIVPVSRSAEVARTEAAGESVYTIIAGYHWFTDWGRDSMISLEGLTLCTGRIVEAAGILRTFAHHVREGLIPNFFPEGEQAGVYHTADATLWFVHALGRYVERSGDQSFLSELLPVIKDIIDHHLRGTRFGIAVDPVDGLLTQGAEHYQLTWMDAKVDDWVVTPRRGKAVEINALWYNALRLVAGWMQAAGDTAGAATCTRAADAAYASFNRRFWNETTGQLFDVVDGEHGDDPAIRPNQILAVALPYPVLEPARRPAVVNRVHQALTTPVGLRSLAPGQPHYQPRYFGDLRARDAAYHQGTVWAWLIGPFVDAWLRVYPDRRGEARTLLSGLVEHLGEAGVGSISEIFDAEAPFTPRGCIAQAWSVAETLRAWTLTTP